MDPQSAVNGDGPSAATPTTVQEAGPRPPRFQRSHAHGHRSAWLSLGRRSFRYYFIGSFISNTGTWFQNTAQVMLAYQLTHSVLAVGVVTCAQFSGALILGPWAAVVSHRIGGKRMLIGMQFLSAAIAAGMAGLQAIGMLKEPFLVAGALGLGLAFTFTLPVQTAMVPRLVPEAETEAAMAMNSVSYNAGRAVAPALCVWMIAASGFTWAFALNALSFVVFGVMLMPTGPRVGMRGPRPRALDGLSIALQKPRIALLLAMVAAVTFADDPVLILGPALAHHLPDASPAWPGYFLSALGAGTILGSLRPTTDPRCWDASRTARRAAWSLLALVSCIALFVASPNAWVSLAAAFLAGAAALQTGAVTQTVLVRQQPADAASVMALWAIAWAGTKPIASLTDGLAAHVAGLHWALVAVTAPALVLAFTELGLLPRWRTTLREHGRDLSRRLATQIDPKYRAVQKAAAATAGPAEQIASIDTVLSCRDDKARMSPVIATVHAVADHRSTVKHQKVRVRLP